jgi:hypothetical protein
MQFHQLGTVLRPPRPHLNRRPFLADRFRQRLQLVVPQQQDFPVARDRDLGFDSQQT